MNPPRNPASDAKRDALVARVHDALGPELSEGATELPTAELERMVASFDALAADRTAQRARA